MQQDDSLAPLIESKETYAGAEAVEASDAFDASGQRVGVEGSGVRVEINNLTEEEAVRVAHILNEHPELARHLTNIGAAYLEHKGHHIRKDLTVRSITVSSNAGTVEDVATPERGPVDLQRVDE
jgi:hypothetical protein